MKFILVFLFFTATLQIIAQQKIERLYISASGLRTFQHTKAFDFFPTYNFEIRSNFLQKHSVGGGYSFWELNEQYTGKGWFGDSYLNSEYESYYLCYGRFRSSGKRTVWSWQGGLSYYRIMELYNFKEIYVPPSGWFGGGYYRWEYDTRFLEDFGVILQTELVSNFWSVTGVIVGLDLHLSKNVQKLNVRIGMPLGYFKGLKKETK